MGRRRVAVEGGRVDAAIGERGNAEDVPGGKIPVSDPNVPDPSAVGRADDRPERDRRSIL